ncbi:hypothetical protein [Leptospira biflexa]|uniref:hypothetical protein n=1 Tax=Leptospira biflexa TaxID=172 RepID=UPI00108490A7|nr:hypothetical protein [Leptospira biflexa]TGM37847.1 hypothetical protein EHQ80_09715 [Leptospira biflexa]TGM41180.1 hypothetical protein EHQ89_04280 [Leptospira biflexa]
MFPLPSVWLLRISLLYFLMGTIIGALLMLQKVFVWKVSLWYLLPIHYSMMIWGFFVQFIIGTAYWMFPKHLSNLPRGPKFQAWLVFFCYNFGFVCLLFSMMIPFSFHLETVGKILMCLAIVIFIKLIWVRSISYNP